MKTGLKVLIAIVVAITLFIVGFCAFVYIFLTSPAEPLNFVLDNRDNETHNVKVEIFNSRKNSIFNESYILDPGEFMRSGPIAEEDGEYIFRVTVDHNLTKEQEIEVKRNFGWVNIGLYRGGVKLFVKIRAVYVP
jgi:hypothetical protein